MTQEEKQLLLKDLCARLPYRVRIAYKDNENDIHHWTLCTLYAPRISKDGTIIDTNSDGWIDYVEYSGAGMSIGSRPLHLEKMLPYLRPMSSMTEEEYGQYMEFIEWSHNDYDGTTITCINKERFREYLNFIYSHHLDDNNFIKNGLALEAPEGMYKTE